VPEDSTGPVPCGEMISLQTGQRYTRTRNSQRTSGCNAGDHYNQGMHFQEQEDRGIQMAQFR
jgi:hypothetical protein